MTYLDAAYEILQQVTGLADMSARYTMLLALQLAQSPNLAVHLLTLEGQHLIGPAEQNLWPDVDALAWYRREVVKKS